MQCSTTRRLCQPICSCLMHCLWVRNSLPFVPARFAKLLDLKIRLRSVAQLRLASFSTSGDYSTAKASKLCFSCPKRVGTVCVCLQNSRPNSFAHVWSGICCLPAEWGSPGFALASPSSLLFRVLLLLSAFSHSKLATASSQSPCGSPDYRELADSLSLARPWTLSQACRLCRPCPDPKCKIKSQLECETEYMSHRFT